MNSNKALRLRLFGLSMLLLAALSLLLGLLGYLALLPESLSHDLEGYPAMALLFMLMGGVAIRGPKLNIN